MAKAKWTSTARRDLKEIGRYIGRHEKRPSIAAKVLREIHAKCNEYSAAFAGGSVMGSDASYLGDCCRVVSHQRWVIVFQPSDGGIEVLRIFDGRRNYQRLFPPQ